MSNPGLSSNSIALAGEFAVLSQLSLRGHDANMTLGHTKGVDILVSLKTGRMLKLEVKTNYRSSRAEGGTSKLFGRYACGWLMTEKHELLADPDLFYCFVHISDGPKQFRFFILPSEVVATYVRDQHQLWLANDLKRSRDTKLRQFRIGFNDETYALPTPTIERYEDNWTFRNNDNE